MNTKPNTLRFLAAVAATALCLSTQAQITNFVVDTFDPGGTTNGLGMNVYSAGGIGNAWTNWFGTAYQSLTWDSGADASNNPSSGAMIINANFDNVGNNQFTVFFGYFNTNGLNDGIRPGLSGYQFTNFQCDVRFDGSSAFTINGGNTNFGHLEFGTRTAGYGQDEFGFLEVPYGDTNWHHVSIAISASTDLNLTNIAFPMFHLYGPWYQANPLIGATKLWVDNVIFVGSTNNPGNLPPPRITMVSNVTPALRFFAGDTAAVYARENLSVAVSNGVSWYNNPSATSFAVTITNFPAMVNQGYEWHLFLIPINYLPSGTDPVGNPYAEYNSSNLLAMRIVCNTSNYAVSLAYKTNLPGANPDVTLANLIVTNPLGVWTLSFPNNDSVTMTAPNGTSTNAAIFDSVASTFADPMVATFGVEANTQPGEGNYVDVTRISIPALFIDDHFNTDLALDPSTWVVTATFTNSIWLATPDSKYWINWTLPDVGFALGESTNTPWQLTSPTNIAGGAIFDTRLITTNRWALLSTNHVAKLNKSLYFGLRKNPTP